MLWVQSMPALDIIVSSRVLVACGEPVDRAQVLPCMQAAALQAFGLPPVPATPALRQSAMQLALGMDVSRGLNLQSWQYGDGEGPTLSMVLDAMDCRASDAFGQAVDALAASAAPADAAEASSPMHLNLHICAARPEAC